MPNATIQKALDTAFEQLLRRQLADAEATCAQVLSRHPRQPDALHLRGLLAAEAGQPARAADLIRRAIAINPKAAEYFFNLGRILSSQGRLDDGIAAIRQGLALQPDNPDAHNSLAMRLREKGQFEDAIASFRRALALQPDHLFANNNLGNMLAELGQADEAIACYRKAIAAAPDSPLPYNNLGAALHNKGELDEALSVLRKATELQPDYADAWNNLGNAHKDLGQLDHAIECFKRAVALEPAHASFHENLVFAMLYHPACHPESTYPEHRRWSQRHAEPLKTLAKPHSNAREAERRLRIGYVSPDFRDHPVARFLLPLLQNHDHQNFEICCYANVAAPDAMTGTMSALADLWRPIAQLDDDSAAELIRRDRVDILVDLAGHTAGNRLLVFAGKPAPVQVTWLGYPDTTGMTAIDYRVTDALADPPGTTERYNVEQLIRLPNTAWCFEPASAAPVDLPAARPDRPITFGSFNYLGKVTDLMLRLWARILSQLPESRLLLKSRGLNSAAAQGRIEAAMAAGGVNLDRLIMCGKVRSYDEHLALYGQMDIALDTFPYNGTTTTCEALWMGVPLVTLAGSTHHSRVSLSLLTNAGLPELVAHSEDDYVRLAVELAGNTDRLAKTRAMLHQQIQTSPLMDAPAFARAMESAYRTMWRKWCSSPTPAV